MAKENKVLIIVYYWPPSGGSGVQRWVKLAKYLTELGVQVHVLTVDERYASYLQTDPTLAGEVHPDIRVVKTRSFEIIKVFARIFGKNKVPSAGFYNLDRKSFIHNLGLVIRSSFFIPDPRRGWNKFAFNKACRIIKNEGITKVITSSPPHSSQLIGLKLKKKLGIEWVADLRDPWTDIFYYGLLRHNILSKRIDRHYELSVLRNSDYIFTVGEKWRELLISKDRRIDPQKVHVIPNGFDEEDFRDAGEYVYGQDFIIGYTGTMSDQYEPWGFLKAFSNLVQQGDGNIYLEITGTISPNIISYIEKLGIVAHIKINPLIPHRDIPSLLVKKSALLLGIPHVNQSDPIVPGKIFEYLASGRPIILIGPKKGNSAAILAECEAGESFEWNDDIEITKHLIHLKSLHDKGNLLNPENNNIQKYSRRKQAEDISTILFRKHSSII